MILDINDTQLTTSSYLRLHRQASFKQFPLHHLESLKVVNRGDELCSGAVAVSQAYSSTVGSGVPEAPQELPPDHLCHQYR